MAPFVCSFVRSFFSLFVSAWRPLGRVFWGIPALPRAVSRLPVTGAFSSVIPVKRLPPLTTPVGAYVGTSTASRPYPGRTTGTYDNSRKTPTPRAHTSGKSPTAHAYGAATVAMYGTVHPYSYSS